LIEYLVAQPNEDQAMAIDTLNNRFHVSQSLWLVLLGSVALGILFSLCWVTAAYGHVRLAEQIVHWVTAMPSAGMSVLYHGLIFCIGIGAVAGAVIALLDLVIRRKEPERDSPAQSPH
jgi:hypothetical protein